MIFRSGNFTAVQYNILYYAYKHTDANETVHVRRSVVSKRKGGFHTNAFNLVNVAEHVQVSLGQWRGIFNAWETLGCIIIYLGAYSLIHITSYVTVLDVIIRHEYTNEMRICQELNSIVKLSRAA